MTQQSTSLIIFWTFILTHSFAICSFCSSLWRTQLPCFFSPIIKIPYLPRHRASRIKELMLCNVLFGNPDITPPQLDVPPAHHCCTSPPPKLATRHRGGNALLTQSYQAFSFYIHNSSTKTFCTVPHHWVKMLPYVKSITFDNLVPGPCVGEFSFLCHMHFNLLQCCWWLSPHCCCEHACHCMFHVILSGNQVYMYSFIVWICILIEFIYISGFLLIWFHLLLTATATCSHKVWMID